MTMATSRNSNPRHFAYIVSKVLVLVILVGMLVSTTTTVYAAEFKEGTTVSSTSSAASDSVSDIEAEQAKLAKAHKDDPYIGELDPKHVLYYDNVTADYTSSEGTIMYVHTQTGLNLREEPDVKSARVRLLLRGEVLTVFPDTLQNDFVRVIAWLDGKVGWVHKDYIKFSQPVDIDYVGYWNSDALANILGADWEDDQDHCCGNQERSEEWHRIMGE